VSTGEILYRSGGRSISLFRSVSTCPPGFSGWGSLSSEDPHGFLLACGLYSFRPSLRNRVFRRAIPPSLCFFLAPTRWISRAFSSSALRDVRADLPLARTRVLPQLPIRGFPILNQSRFRSYLFLGSVRHPPPTKEYVTFVIPGRPCRWEHSSLDRKSRQTPGLPPSATRRLLHPWG